MIIPVILSGFVLGFALHVVLYQPTAKLPTMWRNISRYFLGVSSVLILAGVAISMRPHWEAWQVYQLFLLLFATSGLGVIAGYVHSNGSAEI